MNIAEIPTKMLSADLLARFVAIVGEKNAITDRDAQAPYLTEPRDLFRGKSPVVLRPGSVAEVSAILKLASESAPAIVPQGGNTGLVGGQIAQHGEIGNALNKLKKDNTGYDLKDLFIGAEGTLGVITAAVLRLVPRPRSVETAFIGVPSPQAALDLFGLANERATDNVTSFELMLRLGIEMVLRHGAGCRDPLPQPHPWYVLIELSSPARSGLRAARGHI